MNGPGCGNGAGRIAPSILWACRRLWPTLLLLAAACAGGGGGNGSGAAAADFTAPAECGSCHPRQYREWQGAMMAYATISPVFNALEAAGNRLTEGAFAADGGHPLFCQRCHTPIGVARDEFPAYAAMDGRPSRDFAGDVAAHGLSCDFCHQVAHADMAASLLGDGIANAAFVLTPGFLKYGPFSQPVATSTHDSSPSDFVRSAEFCGTCHDVRLPGTDAATGEPFLRLENAFTEWQQGPYASADNPYGRVVTCQDCHMSAYPYQPPGTYFEDQTAALADAPLREVSTHYFTGVDVALVDFPGQSGSELDSHSLPAAQAQRRADLLRAACTLELDAPDTVQPGDILPITIAVTNVGAGHHVPTGFSQERQMWIELVVSDATGALIYQSGDLLDQPHPETGENTADGSLDDEDLQNLIGSIDPVTLEADIVPGPDADQRPAVNLGLANFGNEFKRMTPDGTHEVLIPFLANHMDNSHSIPPLQTARVPYDVPLPATVQSPLHISARLRFRAFPPRFLRTLAQARPDLVDEELVDRNRIVDMAEAERDTNVAPPRP